MSRAFGPPSSRASYSAKQLLLFPPYLDLLWEALSRARRAVKGECKLGQGLSLDSPRARGIISRQVEVANPLVIIWQYYHLLFCIGDIAGVL
jgi:hypothetical protein